MTTSNIPLIYLKHVKLPHLKDGEKEYLPGNDFQSRILFEEHAYLICSIVISL